MRRSPALAAATALALLAAGCASYQTPEGPVLGTAPGLSWNFPVGPQPPGPPSVPPPPGLMPTASPAATAPVPVAPGWYRGTATVIQSQSNAQADCRDVSVDAFQVVGRWASFLDYAGNIAPDGSVVMRSPGGVIEGRFVGRAFQGRLWNGMPTQPSCTWALALQASS
jgi:hypothetical protein